jgi:putative addiction module killer protein
MSNFEKTEIFKCWLKALKDKQGKRHIYRRIRRAENGNFGDVKQVGEGVSEMRLHFGPGYRLYYFQHDKQVYWLLLGGDKSAQVSDIELAKAIRRKVERGEKC